MATPYQIGTNSAASGTNISIPVSTPTSAGDAIVVAGTASVIAATITSVGPDTKGNVYRQVSSLSATFAISAWVADSSNNSGGTVALTGSDSIPVVYASGTNTRMVAAVGLSGVPNISAVDQTPAATTGTSTAPSITSGTLSQANESVIAIEANVNAGGAITWTAPTNLLVASFQNSGVGVRLALGYQNVSSTSAVTAAGTTGNAAWGVLMVTLRWGPQITTSSLPGGNVGSPYVHTLAGQYGQTAYSWSVTAGSLPPGLSLSSGGTISGTPNTAGTYSFTITLTDAAGATTSHAYSGIVISATPLARFPFVPGFARPGMARPGDPGSALSLPPAVIHQWPFSDTGGYGPVQATVANSTGNGLVAYIASGTDNQSGYLERHAISDDAHNWWIYSGSTTVILAGLNRRVDVWICPNAKAATTVSVSASIVYAGIVGSVCEITHFPQYAQVDFVAPAVSGHGTTGTVSGTAPNSDFVFSAMLLAGANPGTITKPGGAWTSLNTVSTGALSNTDMSNLTISPVFQEAAVAAGAVSATWSWASSAYYAGVLVGFKAVPVPPASPNPNWPSMKVEAAFGYQPGNTTGIMPSWTDITSRVVGPQGETLLEAVRGRDYELTQPEAGTLKLGLLNNTGDFNPANTGSAFYPNVLPEVPVRVSCFWQGRQYGLGYYYASKWSQDFPDPQWGVVTMEGEDALSAASQGSMPSALAGQYLADFPYSYYPLSEFYTTVHGALFNNLSRTNQKPMVGYSPPQMPSGNGSIAAGASLDLGGDPGTGIGPAGTPPLTQLADIGGVMVRDYGVPSLNNGFTVEGWIGAPTATSLGQYTPILGMWGAPANYLSTVTTPNGLRLQVEYQQSTLGGGNGNISATLYAPNGTVIATGANSLGGLGPTQFAVQVIVGATWTMNIYLNGFQATNTPTLYSGPAPDWNTLTAGGCYPLNDALAYQSQYTLGQVAFYAWPLSAQRILAHYTTGSAADSGDFLATRIGKLMTWAGLGLPFGVGAYSAEPNPQFGPADQIAGSALADVLYNTSVDEGGFYYVPATALGEIWYQPRQSVYNRPSKVVFGDNGTTEIPYLPATGFDFSNTYLYNIVSSQRTINAGSNSLVAGLGIQQASNSTGADAIVSDQPSEAAYLPRGPLQVDIETTSDADAYDRADWSLNKYKQPHLRANEIILDCAANPSIFAVALGIEQGDIVTVNRRPVGAAPYSVQCIVEKVKHEVGPDLWDVTLTLAPYYPEGNVLQLDSPSYDLAGSGALGW